MFLKPAKKDKAMKKLVTICQEQSLIPILNEERFLQHLPIQKFLKEIQPFTLLADDQFTEVYTGLLSRFAAFVQMIPDKVGGRLGILFEEGMKRALYALRQINENDPLYIYAVFSSALLADVRKVLVNKRIMLTDTKGHGVTEWLPFTGFMSKSDATHFQVRSFYRPMIELNPHITVLLSRQVMPESGFLWLAKDMKIFNEWMGALGGDEEGFGQIIQAAKSYLRQTEEKPKFIMPVEVLNPTENALGEEFWAWLKNKVSEQGTGEPGSAIQIVDNVAVFLNVPQIFQEFCQDKKMSEEEWQLIYQQFLQLGIAISTRNEPDLLSSHEQLMLYISKSELMLPQKQLHEGFFKEKERRESDYKEQESLIAEYSWFWSKKVEKNNRLRELTRMFKKHYRAIGLRELMKGKRQRGLKFAGKF